MIVLIIIIFLLIAGLIYVKLTAHERYWKKKKVFYVRPNWWKILGMLFGRTSLFELVKEGHMEHSNKRYYGSFEFSRTSLVINDPELIKQITIKDFENFTDHMSILQDLNDPILGLNLFSLEGEKWKDMRSTLSPAFTSSKMRTMFVLMEEAANKFTDYFYKQKNDGIIELDMKNAFTKFSVDIIATCAFGVQCNSLENDQNEFFQKGTVIANPTRTSAIRQMLFMMFPKVCKVFNISILPSGFTNFFKKLVVETMDVRDKNHVIRPDMIHLLMESKKGRLKHEKNEIINEQDTGFATVEESTVGKSQRKLELTDDVIAAQVLIFFLAGFDPISTVLSFFAYHLAIDPTIQNEVYQEIKNVLSTQKSSKITYETLLKMKYLDQVVSETLRMYPPGIALTRTCTKDYFIEAKRSDEVDLVVEKGTTILVQLIGLQRDPKYFPNPDKFDPNRFSDENKENIVPGSYIPFGSGPRNCIGSRFALLEIKALIVSLLNKFEIVPIKKTVIPMKFAKTFNLLIEGGFWLGLKKREESTDL